MRPDHPADDNHDHGDEQAGACCRKPGDGEPADAASPHARPEEKQRRIGSAGGGPFRPGAHGE